MEEEKFRSTTSKWNDNIEKTLKEVSDSCKAYKWINIFAARKNEKKYNILMYSSIIIGPIVGILSAVSTGNINYNIVIQIFVTVFSFLNGVISAVLKFSEFSEKVLSYKTIASKYASLENNIRRQLSLSREDRVNPGEYMDWIISSFDDLFTSAPLIPDSIHDEWIIFAKQNNITITKEFQENKSLYNIDKIDKNINSPSSLPVISPSQQPVISPSSLPVVSPSQQPVISPSSLPVVSPSSLPVISPSQQPVISPSSLPVVSPSSLPVVSPSSLPVISPSQQPVISPSSLPVVSPSSLPVVSPSSLPVISPSQQPVISPSSLHVISPSQQPSPNDITYSAQSDIENKSDSEPNSSYSIEIKKAIENVDNNLEKVDLNPEMLKYSVNKMRYEMNRLFRAK